MHKIWIASILTISACGSVHHDKTDAGVPPDVSIDAAPDAHRELLVFFRDKDGDGHGNAAESVIAYEAPPGYVASSDDCNDDCPSCFPGSKEVCDGSDNDCNGMIDDVVLTTFYRDADGDGYGDAAVTTAACIAPPGYVLDHSDCNDTAGSGAAIHPGATEVCFNAIDDNCDGHQDEAPECSIDCNWKGPRWLSHGFDNGGAWGTGAWVSCVNSKLSYMLWIHGQIAVSPPPAGTGDVLVGCNWDAQGQTTDRWIPQGWDGGMAFSFGATVSCTSGRVTALTWANTQLDGSQTPIVLPGSHNLECNWDGAIYLSNGIDNNCAFHTGVNVTCVNSHLTNFEFVEDPGCPRAGP